MIILVSELIIIVCSIKDVTAADPPVRSPHDRQKILAPNDSFGGDLMEILTLIITMVDDLDKDEYDDCFVKDCDIVLAFPPNTTESTVVWLKERIHRLQAMFQYQH